jgi:hypothetical protein
MDPLARFEAFGLRPLPAPALALLQQHRAPPRLIAHHLLVHDVAATLVAGFQQAWPRVPLNADAVLFGAATHDIGKAVALEELSTPGHSHEAIGRELLLAAQVDPALARFAATHGAWHTAETLEDWLVALADACWKDQRAEALEARINDYLAQMTGLERWETFMALDDLLEEVTAPGRQRLAWQAQFTVARQGQ